MTFAPSYSEIESVRILVSLLDAYGVSHKVVCPGSRNAPIVMSMGECISVIDERCAGFYAMGMTLGDGAPAAVCVTSGSAVLNLAPAVAEACYRNLPVVVISADRPAEQIDRLQPQTIDQPGVLDRFVKMSVNLPEVNDAESRGQCIRLVNDALAASVQYPQGPVHINVPLREPLFSFTIKPLPQLSPAISICREQMTVGDVKTVWNALCNARRPMIVIGQTRKMPDEVNDAIRRVSEKITVLCEPLSYSYGCCPVDNTLEVIENHGVIDDYRPDFVLYMGGGLVTRRLKKMIDSTLGVSVWTLDAEGVMHKPFGHTDRVIRGCPEDFFGDISEEMMRGISDESCRFANRWNAKLRERYDWLRNSTLIPGEESTVRCFEWAIAGKDCEVHYANSMAVRLGCAVADHYIHVNRGVNGIEGSISTAAGHSLVTDKKVFCVTGDLSFFYDSNALWCERLMTNLRILLINNGGGGIFRGVNGMPQTLDWRINVAGAHHASARGICEAYGARYMHVYADSFLAGALHEFINDDYLGPVVLEVTIRNQQNDII